MSLIRTRVPLFSLFVGGPTLLADNVEHLPNISGEDRKFTCMLADGISRQLAPNASEGLAWRTAIGALRKTDSAEEARQAAIGLSAIARGYEASAYRSAASNYLATTEAMSTLGEHGWLMFAAQRMLDMQGSEMSIMGQPLWMAANSLHQDPLFKFDEVDMYYLRGACIDQVETDEAQKLTDEIALSGILETEEKFRQLALLARPKHVSPDVFVSVVDVMEKMGANPEAAMVGFVHMFNDYRMKDKQKSLHVLDRIMKYNVPDNIRFALLVTLFRQATFERDQVEMLADELIADQRSNVVGVNNVLCALATQQSIDRDTFIAIWNAIDSSGAPAEAKASMLGRLVFHEHRDDPHQFLRKAKPITSKLDGLTVQLLIALNPNLDFDVFCRDICEVLDAAAEENFAFQADLVRFVFDSQARISIDPGRLLFVYREMARRWSNNPNLLGIIGRVAAYTGFPAPYSHFRNLVELDVDTHFKVQEIARIASSLDGEAVREAAEYIIYKGDFSVIEGKALQPLLAHADLPYEQFEFIMDALIASAVSLPVYGVLASLTSEESNATTYRKRIFSRFLTALRA